MELKDLKSAWAAYSSQEVDKHRLGKESINVLLQNRTKTLVERFNRNIKIGMFLLGTYIAYVIIDYLFLSSYLLKVLIHMNVEYPKWLEPIGVFSTALIILTYLFFVFRYLKIKQNFSPDTQLKDFLAGIQSTLVNYRRMFYLAVIILLLDITINFAAGVYKGLQQQVSLEASKILMTIGISLLIIISTVALLFFLLRWGFNKLYGRYLNKISETLLELDESENAEL
jgi:hypothetical protein